MLPPHGPSKVRRGKCIELICIEYRFEHVLRPLLVFDGHCNVPAVENIELSSLMTKETLRIVEGDDTMQIKEDILTYFNADAVTLTTFHRCMIRFSDLLPPTNFICIL